jgi:hypothetical protein
MSTQNCCFCVACIFCTFQNNIIPLKNRYLLNDMGLKGSNASGGGGEVDLYRRISSDPSYILEEHSALWYTLPCFSVNL